MVVSEYIGVGIMKKTFECYAYDGRETGGPIIYKFVFGPLYINWSNSSLPRHSEWT